MSLDIATIKSPSILFCFCLLLPIPLQPKYMCLLSLPIFLFLNAKYHPIPKVSMPLKSRDHWDCGHCRAGHVTTKRFRLAGQTVGTQTERQSGYRHYVTCAGGARCTCSGECSCLARAAHGGRDRACRHASSVRPPPQDVILWQRSPSIRVVGMRLNSDVCNCT